MIRWSRLATIPLVVGLIFQFLLIVALAVAIMPGAADANSPVTGAAFTTVNEAVDGTGHCKNGNPNVNCNIYDGKDYVWLNGGPSVAYVGDGDYFFAVLVPGGQSDPNDGETKNLSDAPNGDAYTNRTFSVTGGVVSYSGTHEFSNNKIRLMYYDDTTNPGGVYILAICSLADGYPVDPSDCKYDAFKVQEDEVVPGKPLTITKDANGVYTNTYAWTVTKVVLGDSTVTQNGGTATFTYQVSVSHDGGTVSAISVTGTITVFNPNVDDNDDPVAVSDVDVTDSLSDGTDCDVTDGENVTLTEIETHFAYSCDLANLPQGALDNTAKVSWPEQFLDNGTFLAAGSADFKFKGVSFDETTVDDCVSVDDSLYGSLGTVCVGEANPTTFPTYTLTVNVPDSGCVSYDNTATFTTDDTGATGSDSKTVNVCGEDPTPPTCPVGKIRQGVDAYGIKFAEVDLQDTGSGVASIVQSLNAKNVTLSYKVSGDLTFTPFDPTSPPSVTFDPTETTLITVRGTKIDNAKGSRLEIHVTDGEGNVTTCDPVEEVVIKEDGKPYSATHSNLIDTMSKVTVVNGSPGINSVVLTVNGTKITIKNLKPGEVRKVDISSAMRPGNGNTISLKATGGAGSSATIFIADEWIS